MWAEINGQRKKVACSPCIRGHRSSKCDHKDRVLVEVRKPGRPLSSCPHTSGSCSCNPTVINFTIPKNAKCACPSGAAEPGVSVPTTGNRVQKHRTRKSVNGLNPTSLEKALKTSEYAETDASSFITRAPSTSSLAPSDNGTSSVASSISSNNPSPNILPSPLRKDAHGLDLRLPDSYDAGTTIPSRQGGSCCGGRSEEPPQPVASTTGSCCAGKSQQVEVAGSTLMRTPPAMGQNYIQMQQLQQPGQFQGQPYSAMDHRFVFDTPGNIGMSQRLSYARAATTLNSFPGHPQSASMPMTPTHVGPHYAVPNMPGPSAISSHEPVHDCHCGDSCSCYGCAAHPYNATTMDVVRELHLMSAPDYGIQPPINYNVPSYPHHPGFGAESYQQTNFNTPFNLTNIRAGPMDFQPSAHRAMSISHTSSNATTPWQQPTTAGSHYFNDTSSSREMPLALKIENDVASPAAVTEGGSPNDGKEEDTLSPTAYFGFQVPWPGCSDATGACLCGDGCECVGCLTHGGHDGIPLAYPSEAQNDNFSEWLTTSAFTTAPT